MGTHNVAPYAATKCSFPLFAAQWMSYDLDEHARIALASFFFLPREGRSAVGTKMKTD